MTYEALVGVVCPQTAGGGEVFSSRIFSTAVACPSFGLGWCPAVLRIRDFKKPYLRSSDPGEEDSYRVTYRGPLYPACTCRMYRGTSPEGLRY